MALSLLAHALLGLALAWGVSWTHTDPQVSFSAELWSATVQEAAPAPVAPPPAPPPPPPPPAPPAKPQPPPPPAPRAAEPTKADIALEREKKRKREEELKRDEERKKAQALKDKQAKEKADQAKQAAKERKEEEARKEKARLEKERALEEARKEAARKEAAEAEVAQEKRRQDQLRRIQGLAGATGAPEARGTAPRASAPSSSYAGKIVEQIKNNTSFTDANAGRPTVVVLVKTSASGAIVSSKVVTPSGNKAWDDAVMRAVEKMGSVPRDVDGRIPEVLLQEGLEIKVTL